MSLSPTHALPIRRAVVAARVLWGATKANNSTSECWNAQRAAAGPFGTTIAHGFLTLSLLPHLIDQTYRVEGTTMVINYGLNKVRFPAPVPVGCSVRAEVALAEVTEVSGGLQLVVRATLQIDGNAKPGCVADWVTRVYF